MYKTSCDGQSVIKEDLAGSAGVGKTQKRKACRLVSYDIKLACDLPSSLNERGLHHIQAPLCYWIARCFPSPFGQTPSSSINHLIRYNYECQCNVDLKMEIVRVFCFLHVFYLTLVQTCWKNETNPKASMYIKQRKR